MGNQQKYRAFSEDCKTLPLFSKAWWLDAVIGEQNWDACIVENNGGEILAVMPYTIRKRLHFVILGQALLTQKLGPWFKPLNSKNSKMLGQQKDLMESLIEQLPNFDHFSQNWHHEHTNWLPFCWKGFSQTTRYTYILPDLSNEETLWENLQENIRREIRKSKNRFNLRVRDDLTVKDFIKLNRLVFSRQQMQSPYTDEFVENLDKVCSLRNARKIFIAEDEQGVPHAGVYLVWDENSAYYLMGGGDPELRNSGATSLCMWEAIKFSSTVTKRFDFEGSMIEPIERFFRAFGALQTPYFTVSKTPSRLIRVQLALNGLFKK